MHFGQKNQKGMASIITASIVMIIVGLITVGFAQIMSRNQRQALDRQLSTQAFYAAESGINDAREGLKSIQTAKNTCDVSSPSAPYVQSQGVIDATKDIRYTCLIVNPNPNTLEYDNSSITPDSARIARVESADGSSIGKINIGWETENATGTNNGCTLTNPTASAWPAANHALLHVDVIPADTANLNRDALINRTMSVFLYPDTGCATTTTAYTTTPSRIGVKCSVVSGRDCSLTITGLPASSLYYVRLSSVYKNANATITPLTAADAPISTKNGQASIDVTGRSGDVVRRVLVRVPIKEDVGRVNAAVSTTDSICKLFTLTRDSSGNVVAGDNPACN